MTTTTVTVMRAVLPNTTYNFVDRKTGKVVASASNNTSLVAMLSIVVPAGQWLEQEVRTLAESNGPSRVFTSTASSETDLESGNATAPVLTDSGGGLWQLQVTPIADPVGAPSMSTAASGGTITAGTYTCGFTWVTAAGESKISATANQVTTGSISTLTFSSIPAIPQGAIGYNLYVSAAGVPGVLYKQNATPFTSGTSQTLTAAIVTNTANPPSASKAGLVTATKIA